MTIETNMFERASREKIRFSYRGMCNVEDLWDLTVRELDEIFKFLNAKLKADQEESLLDQMDRVSSELDLQVSVIRRIVDVKLIESAAKSADP